MSAEFVALVFARAEFDFDDSTYKHLDGASFHADRFLKKIAFGAYNFGIDTFCANSFVNFLGLSKKCFLDGFVGMT